MRNSHLRYKHQSRTNPNHDQSEHGNWAEGRGGTRDGVFPTGGGGGGGGASGVGGIQGLAQQFTAANRQDDALIEDMFTEDLSSSVNPRKLVDDVIREANNLSGWYSKATKFDIPFSYTNTSDSLLYAYVMSKMSDENKKSIVNHLAKDVVEDSGNWRNYNSEKTSIMLALSCLDDYEMRVYTYDKLVEAEKDIYKQILKSHIDNVQKGFLRYQSHFDTFMQQLEANSPEDANMIKNFLMLDTSFYLSDDDLYEKVDMPKVSALFNNYNNKLNIFISNELKPIRDTMDSMWGPWATESERASIRTKYAELYKLTDDLQYNISSANLANVNKDSWRKHMSPKHPVSQTESNSLDYLTKKYSDAETNVDSMNKLAHEIMGAHALYTRGIKVSHMQNLVSHIGPNQDYLDISNYLGFFPKYIKNPNVHPMLINVMQQYYNQTQARIKNWPPLLYFRGRHPNSPPRGIPLESWSEFRDVAETFTITELDQEYIDPKYILSYLGQESNFFVSEFEFAILSTGFWMDKWKKGQQSLGLKSRIKSLKYKHQSRTNPNHDQSEHGNWAEGRGGTRDGVFPTSRGGGAGGIQGMAQDMSIASRLQNLLNKRQGSMISGLAQSSVLASSTKRMPLNSKQRRILSSITSTAAQARANTDNFYNNMNVDFDEMLSMRLSNPRSKQWGFLNNLLSQKNISLNADALKNNPEISGLFLEHGINAFKAMRPTGFFGIGGIPESEWESLDFNHNQYIDSLNIPNSEKNIMKNAARIWRNGRAHVESLTDLAFEVNNNIKAFRSSMETSAVESELKLVQQDIDAMFEDAKTKMEKDKTFPKRNEFLRVNKEFSFLFERNQDLESQRRNAETLLKRAQEVKAQNAYDITATRVISDSTKELARLKNELQSTQSRLQVVRDDFVNLINEWVNNDSSMQQQWSDNLQKVEELNQELQQRIYNADAVKFNFYHNVFQSLSRKQNGLSYKVAPMTVYNPSTASTQFSKISPKEIQQLADVMYEMLPDFLGVSDSDLQNSTEINITTVKSVKGDERSYVNEFTPKDLTYATDASGNKTFAKLKMYMGLEPNVNASVVAHELMHTIQNVMGNNFYAPLQKWIDSHIDGETLTPLMTIYPNRSYKFNEYAYRDDVSDAYILKKYGNQRTNNPEQFAEVHAMAMDLMLEKNPMQSDVQVLPLVLRNIFMLPSNHSAYKHLFSIMGREF